MGCQLCSIGLDLMSCAISNDRGVYVVVRANHKAREKVDRRRDLIWISVHGSVEPSLEEAAIRMAVWSRVGRSSHSDGSMEPRWKKQPFRWGEDDILSVLSVGIQSPHRKPRPSTVSQPIASTPSAACLVLLIPCFRSARRRTLSLDAELH